MVRKLLSIVMLSLAIAILTAPAAASLVPMSWGFPQMVQDHTITAFEKDTAVATDNEASAIAFPTTASSITDGVFATSSFPTISQTAVQSNMLSSVKFMNENQHFAFAYPFLSIGGSPVPSMGFL
ncbi:MAG: hypothetical protein WBZ29_14330 [Methanocella sp.]